MNIAIEQRDYPFAFVELAFPRGARLDPVGLDGLAFLTGEMLLRGAGGRSYHDFQDALDALGASLDVSVGRETIPVSADFLTETRGEFFALLRDVLMEANFEQDELDRVRRQIIAELEELPDNDEGLGQHLFNQVLLAPDRSARPTKGTSESLLRIGIPDIRAMAKNLLVREGLVIGSAGNLSTEDLEQELGPSRLPLPLTSEVALPPWERHPRQGIHVWLIDKPERTQTQIYGGHSAPPIGVPDHDALIVANTIFGGTFTSRLSHEIREKRGWSYGAYSSYSASRNTGSFFFRYYPAAKDAVAALGLGLELMESYVREGPTEEELRFAQSYFGNQAPFRFETPHKQLAEAMQCQLLGLPADAYDRQLASIARLDREQVHAAAQNWLHPRKLAVMMVCTAAELIDGVRAIPGVESVTVLPHTTQVVPSPGGPLARRW